MVLNHYPGTLASGKWEGSQPQAFSADRVVSGTLDRARDPRPQFRAYSHGTTQVGSYQKTSLGRLTIDARGKVWSSLVAGEVNQIIQTGTLTLRSGTDSRLGTVEIGSVESPTAVPRGVKFDARGRLWHSETTTDFIFQLGTLGLRGGTDSRIGTQAIGSVLAPGTSPGGLGFDHQGRLYVVNRAPGRLFQIGTLGLRNGTDSRIGTQVIGSVDALDIEDVAFDERGRLFYSKSPTGEGYIVEVGTLGLRNGTDSRLGTQVVGSVGSPSMFPSGLDVDDRDRFWVKSGLTQYAVVAEKGGVLRSYGDVYGDGLPRRLSLTATLSPTLGNESGLEVVTTRNGTVQRVQNPAGGESDDVQLTAWLSKDFGSWKVRPVGNEPDRLRWVEYEQNPPEV